MKPIFDKAGIKVKDVYVADDTSAPDVSSAMSADRRRQDRCVLVDPDLAELHQHVRRHQGPRRDADRRGHDRPVFGTPMTEHLKDAGDSGAYPDGWYFGGYGYSYFLPSTTPGMAESGMNT